MKVTVTKYDPTTDEKPYTVDYDVPKTENMTVLEAMMYIDENLEPLAYDHSCGGRICGRCAVMVNGEPCTACTKAVRDEAIAIEPLKGVPVIRDLVVDKTAMHDRINRIVQRQRPTYLSWDEAIQPMDPNACVALEGIERCARCLVCNASCPALAKSPGQYIGPAGMINVALRYYDAYDEGDRVAEAVQEGLWNCIMCGKCDEVCPAADIQHIKAWTELRAKATERGLTEGTKPILPFGGTA